jgi:hypothetical protein
MRPVLFGQGHVVAIGAAPSRPPRLDVEHQGKQAERFRLVGQQGDDQPRQKDRLAGEVAA